jgi:hypothetical protein
MKYQIGVVMIKIIHEFNITKRSQIFSLYGVSDLHIGSIAFTEEPLKRLEVNINEDISKGITPLIVLNGDIIDDDRPSTRMKRKEIFLDRREAYIAEDLEKMKLIEEEVLPKIQFLKKIKGLGILDGDHYREFSTGKTSTEILSNFLNIPYLSTGQALIFLKFKNRKKENYLVIHAHHGRGGAVKSGSDVNRFIDFTDIWENIDIFVRGHSHQPLCKPIGKYIACPQTQTFKEKEVWLMNSGSSRKGMLEGFTDYAEKALYRFQPLRFPKLLFNVNSDLYIKILEGSII